MKHCAVCDLEYSGIRCPYEITKQLYERIFPQDEDSLEFMIIDLVIPLIEVSIVDDHDGVRHIAILDNEAKVSFHYPE